MPYVTKPFKSFGQGHGVGLALVNLALENIGGKLEIDSLEEKYCDMQMYIPIKP